jgi:hypothetical protein
MSQEYVAVEGHGNDNVNQRIDNVETMVSQLLKSKRKTKDSLNGNYKNQVCHADGQMTPPLDDWRMKCGSLVFNIDNSKFSTPSILSPSQRSLNECFSLSKYLHSVMPDTTVTMMIFTQANYLQMPFQMFCRLRNTASSEICDRQSTLIRASRKPSPTSHPVIFAQSLYKIALCMQQLDPATLYETKNNLKEPVRDASKRFVDIAIKHVTSHDTLMESLDGIETLMLEAGYHFRVGNHHAAWLTLRRAIGLAELIGLRNMRLGDDAAESVWYLLNYSDRFSSAIAGLPCNSSDNSFASERVLAGKSVVERLGRIQVALLGRVIDRSMKIQCCNRNNSSDDDLRQIYEQTKGIDCDLKRSANILPVDSWVMPNFTSSASDKDISKITEILQVQMHHYYLLLLLHQPYLLRKSYLQTTERMPDLVDYRYSKLTTISASRDLLNRFLILRDIHHASSYRGLDHKAWLASTTLLLAHIDTHQLPSGDPLEHQRQQDIAMIYRLVDRFRKAAYRVESVQQICTLLEMEANAANGEQYYFTWSENTESAKVPDSFQLSIPYFGTISVLSATPEMPQSWITSTNLPSFELADYEGFQDSDFARSNLLAHSRLESTDFFQTKNLESFSAFDTASLFDRTEDINFEPESVLRNPLELNGDLDLLAKMQWTQPDMSL